MKNYKILTVLTVMFASLFIQGCTKLTDGYSTDPVNITNPSVIASSKYLTGLQVNVIGVYEGDMARQTGMWTGYFSGDQRQYQGLATYVTSSGDYNGEWDAIYASVLIDAKILKSKARTETNFVTIGITQVMEAMVLGMAADLWGDIPYTQALQYPNNVHPIYDTQASIYTAIQAKLDSAITNLGGTGNGNGDIFLGGSANLYTAVAHSLKARYYLHVRDYANAITQASSGIAAGNDMMAQHGPGYLQDFNIYYSFMNYDRAGYMGGAAYAPTVLDPASATYKGNAKTDETARFNWLYLVAPGYYNSDPYDPNYVCDFDWGSGPGNDGFFGGVSSFPLVTFAENQLILAEANLKAAAPNFNGGLGALNSLRDYYNSGAQFSGNSVNYGTLPHVYADYSAADFAAGGLMNQGSAPANDALLKEILTEKWISLIGQIEAWTDLRRTNNYLNLPVIPGGQPSLAVRLLYPQIELNTNQANVPPAGVGHQALFVPVASFATPY